MKADRLLSIIIYLLNRDLVSARELAERFEVSVRTIQRDMETIELAGIPIMTIQGPHGGYSLMEGFSLDRQLVGVEDLFHIITALSSVGASLPSKSIPQTIEKMKALLPGASQDEIGARNQKLIMDFSAFGGSVKQQELFRRLEHAIDNSILIAFDYTNNRFEAARRIVEPMTLAFKWRSWYLIGYCRLREDYRIFRLGRIKNLETQERHFSRREFDAAAFIEQAQIFSPEQSINLKLRFDACMRHLVEEFFPADKFTVEADGSLLTEACMPESGWVYGHILSYGEFVEVLEPAHIRKIIRSSAENIKKMYD